MGDKGVIGGEVDPVFFGVGESDLAGRRLPFGAAVHRVAFGLLE
ncbi:MAG: hypothetical protein ABEI57_07290 [Halapricum sp.]